MKEALQWQATYEKSSKEYLITEQEKWQTYLMHKQEERKKDPR